MTTAVNDRVDTALGDGITTIFPFGFPIENEADVVVTVDGAVVTTYLVDTAAQTITFYTAPDDGAKLVFYGETEAIQEVEYSRVNNSYQLEALENQLDRMVRITQEHKRDLLSTVRVLAGQTIPAIDMSGLVEGDTLMLGPDNTFIPGPSGADIEGVADAAAEAVAAKDTAITKAAEAAASAATINLPALDAAEKFKHLRVKEDASGYDFVAPPAPESVSTLYFSGQWDAEIDYAKRIVRTPKGNGSDFSAILTGSFTRASDAREYNAAGYLTLVGAGKPRYAKAPNSGLTRGLRLERGTTNFCPTPLDGNALATVGLSAPTLAAAGGIFGAASATRWTASGAGQHYVRADVDVTAGTTYVMSVFAQKETTDSLREEFDTSSLGGAATALVSELTYGGELSAGAAVTDTGYGINFIREQKIARMWGTQTATVTESLADFFWYIHQAGLIAKSYTAVGETLLLEGFQIEAGKFPTSFYEGTRDPETHVITASELGLTSFRRVGVKASTIFTEAGCEADCAIIELRSTAGNGYVAVVRDATVPTTAKLVVAPAGGGAAVVVASATDAIAVNMAVEVSIAIYNDRLSVHINGEEMYDGTAVMPGETLEYIKRSTNPASGSNNAVGSTIIQNFLGTSRLYTAWDMIFDMVDGKGKLPDPFIMGVIAQSNGVPFNRSTYTRELFHPLVSGYDPDRTPKIAPLRLGEFPLNDEVSDLDGRHPTPAWFAAAILLAKVFGIRVVCVVSAFGSNPVENWCTHMAPTGYAQLAAEDATRPDRLPLLFSQIRDAQEILQQYVMGCWWFAQGESNGAAAAAASGDFYRIGNIPGMSVAEADDLYYNTGVNRFTDSRLGLVIGSCRGMFPDQITAPYGCENAPFVAQDLMQGPNASNPDRGVAIRRLLTDGDPLTTCLQMDTYVDLPDLTYTGVALTPVGVVMRNITNFGWANVDGLHLTGLANVLVGQYGFCEITRIYATA